MNVAIIPARGGSKRIKRKNIRQFNGKAIIAYSIELALESGLFEKVVVSTDDWEIGEVSRGYGAEILGRGAGLSGDEAGTPAVVANALWLLEDGKRDGLALNLPYEYACCIYATAPMIDVEDLKRGLRELQARPEALFSFAMGTEPPKDAGQWYWGRSTAWIRGIDLVGHYTIMVPIAKERVCDINFEDDWVRAERMHHEMNWEDSAYPFEKPPCEHDYVLHMVDPAERPWLVHGKCRKCGAITEARVPA